MKNDLSLIIFPDEQNPLRDQKLTMRRELVAEVMGLSRKLRDAPYESQAEFLEDLNTLCDKLSLLKDLI